MTPLVEPRIFLWPKAHKMRLSQSLTPSFSHKAKGRVRCLTLPRKELHAIVLANSFRSSFQNIRTTNLMRWPWIRALVLTFPRAEFQTKYKDSNKEGTSSLPVRLIESIALHQKWVQLVLSIKAYGIYPTECSKRKISPNWVKNGNFSQTLQSMTAI